ncbi:MAG: anti-phage dCTP deaminase [Kiloniellaceae bacterium]
MADHEPDLTKLLQPVQGPELVIGLVGPIGTDLKLVQKILSEELEKVGYQSIDIQLTELLQALDIGLRLKSSPLEERYSSYIDAGNKLRQITGRQDVFALLSVLAVQQKRTQLTGRKDDPASHTAYVLHQFKRPEEIRTLRKIYGRGFIQISAYCSKERRLDRLSRSIKESHHGEHRAEYYKGKAFDLINRDDAEEEEPSGQRVRDTFPLADAVVDAESEPTISNSCARFIRAYFGDNFVTPTVDEYGAYAAKATSLRSADLSRQVGAVIMHPTGEIISMGCNEVPKAGGGTYWEGDENDSRDFVLGYDSSAKAKKEMLEDIFRRLKQGWLHPDKQRLSIPDLVEQSEALMRDAHFMDVLEFGRIVHAEMSAISDAARLGRSIKGATLYSTTFPCHICARHIVASGIHRVVYMEPYSKSLALDLYGDSIQIGRFEDPPKSMITFEQFVGIGPERYAEMFSKGKRKDSKGVALKWNPDKAEPILERIVPAYLQIETAVLGALSPIVRGLSNSKRGKRKSASVKRSKRIRH